MPQARALHDYLLSLATGGHVLHDPNLAETILDGVLENGRQIQLRGPSYPVPGSGAEYPEQSADKSASAEPKNVAIRDY